MAGPPTRPRAARGPTRTRRSLAAGSPRVTRPLPGARAACRGCGGAGDRSGRGAWGCNKEDVFPDLGDPEGPGLWIPQRAEPVQAGGCPPRPSLGFPPALPAPPVVFLSSPGRAQPEPHRTWAGGSRPGRSRQLSQAPRARSPCSRSRLHGGPGLPGTPPQAPAQGLTPLPPSARRSRPPSHSHTHPVLGKPQPHGWVCTFAQNNNPLCRLPFATHCVEEPFPCHIPPAALLPILQPCSCDPQGQTHTGLQPSAQPPGAPSYPTPGAWQGRSRSRGPGPAQNWGHEDSKPLGSPPDPSLQASPIVPPGTLADPGDAQG